MFINYFWYLQEPSGRHPAAFHSLKDCPQRPDGRLRLPENCGIAHLPVSPRSLPQNCRTCLHTPENLYPVPKVEAGTPPALLLSEKKSSRHHNGPLPQQPNTGAPTLSDAICGNSISVSIKDDRTRLTSFRSPHELSIIRTRLTERIPLNNFPIPLCHYVVPYIYAIPYKNT